MNTTTTKPKAIRALLLAIGLVSSGALLSAASPAQADPPRHAPAIGYRRKLDREHDRRERERERQREWARKHNSRDRDHDGIPNWRDPHPNTNNRYIKNRRDNDAWRRVDSDRDGIPNYRDRYPNDRRRH
ncbi:MAG: hypothetical protein QM758_05075 [Armatimonas sp.]